MSERQKPASPREVKEQRADIEREERQEAASQRLPETRARLQAAVERRDEAVEEKREARASLDVAEEKFAASKSERDAALDSHKQSVNAVQSAESDVFTRRRELDDDQRGVNRGE